MSGRETAPSGFEQKSEPTYVDYCGAGLQSATRLFNAAYFKLSRRLITASQATVSLVVTATLLVLGSFQASAITKSAPATTTGKPVAAATAPHLSPAPLAAGHSAPTSAATDEDIRDIRPPYHIAPGWLWLAWTASGVGLAALGYGLWRWRHRLPGLRPKLPFELALDQLEAARELMQPEQAREFSICVSEIVRTYIEVHFATRAAHRTTEEFLHDCLTESVSSLSAHRDLLAAFLHHCDLAKFARWVLSVPEMETMLQSASNFVRETGATETQISKQTSEHSENDTVPSSLPGTAEPAAPALEATPGHPASVPAGAPSTLHPLPL